MLSTRAEQRDFWARPTILIISLPGRGRHEHVQAGSIFKVDDLQLRPDVFSSTTTAASKVYVNLMNATDAAPSDKAVEEYEYR